MQEGALSSYYGGKWRIANWILEHMPPHRTYIEPFGGLASVLLKKYPSQFEVYNDLNNLVVNLFKVLRDPELGPKLVDRIEMTPYARTEFEQAWYTKYEGDAVTLAWKFLVYSNSGVGSAPTSDRTSLPGWDNRIYSLNRSVANKNKAKTWNRLPEYLQQAITRLKNVAIEHRDAFDIIDNYCAKASAGTLFYIDPPYMDVKGYQKVQFGREHHERLLARILSMEDMVLLSGYSSPLYNEALADWTCYTRTNTNMNNDTAVECLWLNPQAQDELEKKGSVYRRW